MELKRFSLTLLITLFLGLTSCSGLRSQPPSDPETAPTWGPPIPVAPPGSESVVILGFNDFHGALFPLEEKTVEVAGLRKDGARFPVELSISAMNIKNRWHAAGIIRDITKRKEAEDSIKKQLDELLRFQKATIQREFRIKELKDEVQILKKRIEEMEKKAEGRKL